MQIVTPQRHKKKEKPTSYSCHGDILHYAPVGVVAQPIIPSSKEVEINSTEGGISPVLHLSRICHLLNYSSLQASIEMRSYKETLMVISRKYSALHHSADKAPFAEEILPPIHV